MRTLHTFLNEGLSSNERFFCETFVSLYTDCKLTKDQVSIMLSNLNIKLLKALSDFFEETDGTNYLAYEPKADLFLNDTNKDKIISSMSEYVSKYIAN